MRRLSRVAIAFAVLALVCGACTAGIVFGLRQRPPPVVIGAAVLVAEDEGECPAQPVCLPMLFTLGNQLSMSGTLFGRHCTFLVDTGFTYSVLSAQHKADPSSKDRILLQWSGDPKNWHPFKVRKWVATAQQGTNRLPLVEMGADATSLGPHGTPTTMEGQLALVQPLGDMLTSNEYDAPLGGIVGASFMKRYVVIFDYVNRCISYTCALPEQPAGTVRIRNRGRRGLATIVVPAKCVYGDKSAKLMVCIDTGAGASIFAQSATKQLLPERDPARRRRTHARFGDGDLAAYEYTRGSDPLTLTFSDDDAAVSVEPRTVLMLPEDSPTVSAMSGHDALIGTAFLRGLRLTIDYTVDPFQVYVFKPDG